MGFLLESGPDTARAPDGAFVRAGRDASRRGYYAGAPDLAIEVLSPGDRPGYVREKVAEWLEFGTGAVWVVDPYARTLSIHTAGSAPVTLGEGDMLTGGDLLSGFELPVRDIFA